MVLIFLWRDLLKKSKYRFYVTSVFQLTMQTQERFEAAALRGEGLPKRQRTSTDGESEPPPTKKAKVFHFRVECLNSSSLS